MVNYVVIREKSLRPGVSVAVFACFIHPYSKQNEINRNCVETTRPRVARTIRVMFNTVLKGLIMKPWIQRTLAGLFGVSILVGGLTACSSANHRHGPMTAEKMAEVRGKVVERVSSKLHLNEEQKQKLNVLADRLEAQRTAFMGQAADPRAEMQAIVASDKFDRARAQALLDAKTQAIRANSPEVLNALADFYDSLDSSQQQKVRELMQRRKGWMAHG